VNSRVVRESDGGYDAVEEGRTGNHQAYVDPEAKRSKVKVVQRGCACQ